jgi:polysaccharide biosynthesis protein PslH
MKILFLTQILPYPPDAGPRVKTWNVLAFLADQGYQVTLVSFVRKEEEKYIPEIQERGIEVIAVPIQRSRVKDLWFFLKSVVTGLPFIIERDNLPGMVSMLRDLFSRNQYDVINADQLTMTQFVLDPRKNGISQKAARVFDSHNATWKIVERMVQTANPLLRPVLRFEAARIKAYEGKVIRQFEKTIALTDIDRDYLAEAALTSSMSAAQLSKIIEIVPITVDAQKILPVQRQTGSTNILTLGTLYYPPNADGIRWFINDVFPEIRRQIPDAKFTIIGKNPPADFLSLAQETPQSIEVTGYVPDLRPYLEKSCLMVVPVRVGSGMRVRILEAFAYGYPVVTTTIGLEGIQARPEEDILVADDPVDFASQVIRLIQNPDLQAELSRNGRKLAETQYDRRVVLPKLAKIYSSILQN